jgi:hypothetical protein
MIKTNPAVKRNDRRSAKRYLKSDYMIIIPLKAEDMVMAEDEASF